MLASTYNSFEVDRMATRSDACNSAYRQASPTDAAITSVTEAVAASLSARILRDLGRDVPYPRGMGNPFERWHKELLESDRDPKTRDRYWQIACSYRVWLGDRPPDVPGRRGLAEGQNAPPSSPFCLQLHKIVLGDNWSR